MAEKDKAKPEPPKQPADQKPPPAKSPFHEPPLRDFKGSEDYPKRRRP